MPMEVYMHARTCHAPVVGLRHVFVAVVLEAECSSRSSLALKAAERLKITENELTASRSWWYMFKV